MKSPKLLKIETEKVLQEMKMYTKQSSHEAETVVECQGVEKMYNASKTPTHHSSVSELWRWCPKARSRK